ncbi:hypothetical protein D0Y65_035412 [Glycine soja]|uniref:Uncharacterized protein n=2 Tax=Glycine soja TaxID=3848 RepID=A0A445HB53_GLYSO|nr:hypothetical protein D0Y65_035412 [Glycine soja]
MVRWMAMENLMLEDAGTLCSDRIDVTLGHKMSSFDQEDMAYFISFPGLFIARPWIGIVRIMAKFDSNLSKWHKPRRLESRKNQLRKLRLTKGKDFNPYALFQSSMLSQFDHDMLSEAGPCAFMHSITCFHARNWGIADFWVNEFEKVDVKSKKAQTKLAKAEQALVEATRVNVRLLQSVKESQKSLESTGTKLKKVETREEALKSKLATVESLAKALQGEIEHLNKEFSLFKVNVEKAEE